MSRKTKIAKGTNLTKIFKDGDIVELFFVPIEKYKAISREETKPCMIEIDALPLILLGSFEVVVFGVTSSEIEVSFSNDIWNYIRFGADQLTHFRTIKSKKDTKSAEFGEIELGYDGIDLTCNEWVLEDAEHLVAWLLDKHGFVYTSKAAKPFFELAKKGKPKNEVIDEWEINFCRDVDEDDYYFLAGCAKATKQQFLDALDWCADQFGWND